MTHRSSIRSVRSARLGLERLEPRCVLSASNAAALFQMRLEVVDVEGTPVQQVAVGAEFDVRLLAKDLRTTPGTKGLFAAYADIVYRDSLVNPVANDKGSIRFDGEYTSGRNFEFTRPGVIDEVGAVAGIRPTGHHELVVASVRFRAEAAGVSRFGLDAADDKVMHPILAYGLNDTMTADTAFVGTTVRIIGADGEMVADDGWIPSEDRSVGMQNYIDPAGSKGKEPAQSPVTLEEQAIQLEKHRNMQLQIHDLAKTLANDLFRSGHVNLVAMELLENNAPEVTLLVAYGKGIAFSTSSVTVFALPQDRWLTPPRLAPSFTTDRLHLPVSTNDLDREGREMHAGIMVSANDRSEATWHNANTVVSVHRGPGISQADTAQGAEVELAMNWQVALRQFGP